VFQTYTGTVGYSADGFGSVDGTGTISAGIPAGATVIAAYLYTSTYSCSGGPCDADYVPTGTLNGSALSYTALGQVVGSCCGLQAWRADVTSIVDAQVGTASGLVQDFSITEGAESFERGADGSALVVVYDDPTASISTVAILDGFSATTGDSATFTLGAPTDASFTAEMALGIGFSVNGQNSQIDVNGTRITNNAGDADDAVGAITNGSLITVGGFDDAYSTFLPDYADDTERYDITPYIALGSTSIKVDTLNPTNNDNIFLEVFKVSGEADVTTVPEPTTLLLTASGLLGLMGVYGRRRMRK
jgi:hypothetical protein